MKKIKLINPENPRSFASSILVIVVVILVVILVVISNKKAPEDIALMQDNETSGQSTIVDSSGKKITYDKNGNIIKEPIVNDNDKSDVESNIGDALEPDFDIDILGDNKKLPKGEFFNAIVENDLKKIQSMAVENPNILNTLDAESGVYPLQYAVLRENYEIVRYMVASKADVNVKGKSGRTPLHLASYVGNEQIAKLLLDYNAKINEKDKTNSTAIFLASGRGHDDVAKLILKHKPELNVKEKNTGYTELHVAVLAGLDVTVKEMLSQGANKNIKSNTGETAVDVAEMMPRNEKGNMTEDQKDEVRRYKNILEMLK